MSKGTVLEPVESFALHERCQPRETLDRDVIEEYAQAYRDGETLPSIEVFRVDGEHVVVDGWHRVLAARASGLANLTAQVVGEGTIDQAIWHACQANRGHGLRRSNADKRVAVMHALSTQIGQEQSSRTIAEHCGVTHPFVSKIREELEAGQTAVSDSDDLDARCKPLPPERAAVVGKDGKRHPKKKVKVEGVDPPSDPAQKASAIRELASEIRRLRIRLRTSVDGLIPGTAANDLDKRLKGAQVHLEGQAPEQCPRCKGEKCTRCEFSGWVPRFTALHMREIAKARKVAG